MSWVQLTKRTNMPKLTWLLRNLREQGVQARLNGESFHAPIMEIEEAALDTGWRILGAVDDLPDDDEMFADAIGATAWWARPSALDHETAALASALGLFANKLRTMIADGSECIPKGASRFDCPLATGTIDQCPKALWPICGPMVRVEVYGMALGNAIAPDDEAALRRYEELVGAIRTHLATLPTSCPEGIYMITLAHVLSTRMTATGWSDLRQYALGPILDLVRDMTSEDMTVSEKTITPIVVTPTVLRLAEALSPTGFTPNLN